MIEQFFPAPPDMNGSFFVVLSYCLKCIYLYSFKITCKLLFLTTAVQTCVCYLPQQDVLVLSYLDIS